MATPKFGEAGPGTEKKREEEMDTMKNGKRIIGEVRLHIDTTRMEQ